MQQPNFFGAQLWNGEELVEAVGRARPQIVVVLRCAGIDQLLDDTSGRGADARHGLELAAARQSHDVFVDALDGARSRLKRTRLEGVLTVKVEQCADFLEHERDGVLIHPPALPSAAS